MGRIGDECAECRLEHQRKYQREYVREQRARERARRPPWLAPMEKVGERRRSLGISSRSLAAAASLSRRTVLRAEWGCDISLPKREQLSATLDRLELRRRDLVWTSADYITVPRLRAILKAYGVSGKRFARISGIGKTTVYRALNGYRVEPRTAQRIAQALARMNHQNRYRDVA